MIRPPCWPVGQPCPNPCAAAFYDRTVYNRTALAGPWEGWRMAGNYLVAPDGDRITPERLRGLLWRQQAEAKLAAAQTRRKKRVTSGEVTALRARNSELPSRRPRLRRSGGSP